MALYYEHDEEIIRPVVYNDSTSKIKPPYDLQTGQLCVGNVVKVNVKGGLKQ